MWTFDRSGVQLNELSGTVNVVHVDGIVMKAVLQRPTPNCTVAPSGDRTSITTFAVPRKRSRIVEPRGAHPCTALGSPGSSMQAMSRCMVPRFPELAKKPDAKP